MSRSLRPGALHGHWFSILRVLFLALRCYASLLLFAAWTGSGLQAQQQLTGVLDRYGVNITWQDRTGFECFPLTNNVYFTNLTGAVSVPLSYSASCDIPGGGTVAGSFDGVVIVSVPTTITGTTSGNTIFIPDEPLATSVQLQGAWTIVSTTPQGNLINVVANSGVPSSTACPLVYSDQKAPLTPGTTYPVMVQTTCVSTNLFYAGTLDGDNFFRPQANGVTGSVGFSPGGVLSSISGSAVVTPLYRVSVPALRVLAMDWSARTDPGLDFVYSNEPGSLPTDTTAKLFWANGENLANAFTNNPIWTIPLPKGFSGTMTNRLAESLFYNPPPNATHVILALDPDDLITTSNKANRVRALRNTFRHVVLVMMENRSFDHFLGWLPGANGIQAGLTYVDNQGQSHSTWPLGSHYQGCSCDLPEQVFGAKLQFNNGACDGWLRANTNGLYTIGYYVQTNLAFFGQIAPKWTVCDNYFAAVMAKTQPNRIYQHAAQTSILTNNPGYAAVTSPLTLPTIWDRLAETNIFARYYYAGRYKAGSVLSLWGLFHYDSINYQIDQFYEDCAHGTLPAVSYVDPDFTSVRLGAGLGDAGGNDNHPHSDIRNGERFLADIYNAIVTSPTWASTVMIINFDEWGGFYDHVAPPVVKIEQAEEKIGNDGGLGFRVPCVVISPWSHRSVVSHEQFDHCSVLKLIEKRWQLSPLTVRDADAKDLADVLDLDHPDFTPPSPLTDVPAGPFGFPCQTIQAEHQSDGSLRLQWDDTCPRVLTIQKTDNFGVFFPSWTDFTNVYQSPLVLPPDDQSNGFFRYRIK